MDAITLNPYLGVGALHGAHDERQADEDQRDHDTERRVGDLDAKRRGRLADPALGRIERGERDAGDRGGQRKGRSTMASRMRRPGNL